LQRNNGTSLHHVTPIGIGDEHFLPGLMLFSMFSLVFSINKCHKLYCSN